MLTHELWGVMSDVPERSVSLHTPTLSIVRDRALRSVVVAESLSFYFSCHFDVNRGWFAIGELGPL